jgi:hypothetical protein
MDEIVTSVKHVADIMNEITAASQEQSSGIEEVNRAIAEMDEMTQQNAALVEEAAAAAGSMQEQAVKLEQAVAVFKLGATDVQKAAAMPARAVQQPKAVAQKALAVSSIKAPSAVTARPQSPRSSDEWEEF